MCWLYGLSGCHPVEYVPIAGEKSQCLGSGWARFGAGGRYVKLSVALG